MTRAETAALLQTIVVFWPRSEVRADELTLTLWHEALSDLPGDVVTAAVKRMAATLKFTPCVADIRENVAEAVREAQGVPTAGEAWSKVRRAISRYGYYRPDEARAALGEEIWHAVEMVGGWRELCAGEGDVAITSAQFERRYNAMVQQDMNRIQIPASVNEEMKRLVGPLTEKLMIGGGE